MKICRLGALAAAMVAAAAAASETVSYSYDALGRLVRTSTTGGPNAGKNVGTNFDPAGNRCRHGPAATGTATTCGGTGTGGGGGGGTNQPPVAVNDSGTMTRCANQSFQVLANDSDPDGNLPLALVSVSYGGARGTAAVSGPSVVFTPNGTTGSAAVTYTMRDSLNATASATLSINIIVGDCGPIE